MKGVILAGGTGSRLFPLTKVTNKHLLPVGRYPMIFHPVSKLAEAGIRDILVVTGTEHMGDIVRVLGSGRAIDMELTYRVQDEAGGIAQALSLAEDFVGNSSCVVALADNVLSDSIAIYVTEFQTIDSGAMVLLKAVPDPQRYGVAQLDPTEARVIAIQEKPIQTASPLAVTGVYMYDHHVFDIIRTLKPSARGELEITDVNNAYITKGRMAHRILTGWWTDAGTPESLQFANRMASGLLLPLFERGEQYKAAGGTPPLGGS